MNLTAVTDSINKKQMNGAVKRSHSTMTPTRPLKYEGTKDAALRPTTMPTLDARDYFSRERAFANVKIVFHEQTLWCDKASLAAASPVLRDLFLKTNNDDEVLTLGDDDDDADEFLSMLEFIYPLFNPDINDENMSSLVRIAQRFQFGSLSDVLSSLSPRAQSNDSASRCSSTRLPELCENIFRHNPACDWQMSFWYIAWR